MAPITVAVESLTTPADAITAASGSRSQNRLRRRLRSGPSKKSWSRIRVMSSWARLVTGVVPVPCAGLRVTSLRSIRRQVPLSAIFCWASAMAPFRALTWWPSASPTTFLIARVTAGSTLAAAECG
jgi:hypothetical protein